MPKDAEQFKIFIDKVWLFVNDEIFIVNFEKYLYDNCDYLQSVLNDVLFEQLMFFDYKNSNSHDIYELRYKLYAFLENHEPSCPCLKFKSYLVLPNNSFPGHDTFGCIEVMEYLEKTLPLNYLMVKDKLKK